MICVIAKLPPDAVERLDLLRRTVVSDEQSVKPLYGHITLATCLPDNDEKFIRDCAGIVRGAPAFSVCYEKLEVLPETSIIVATPSKPDALLALHGKITEKYCKLMDQWTCGSDWYPHTTLLYDPAADLNALCRNMQQHFVPFSARVSQVEFSKVEEAGYTILKSVDLEQPV